MRKLRRIFNSSLWVPIPAIRPSSRTMNLLCMENRADPLGHNDRGGVSAVSSFKALSKGRIGLIVQSREAVIKNDKSPAFRRWRGQWRDAASGHLKRWYRPGRSENRICSSFSSMKLRLAWADISCLMNHRPQLHSVICCRQILEAMVPEKQDAFLGHIALVCSWSVVLAQSSAHPRRPHGSRFLSGHIVKISESGSPQVDLPQPVLPIMAVVSPGRCRKGNVYQAPELPLPDT